MDKPSQLNKSEEEIYNHWEQSGYFKADPDSSKPPYSLLMPPPNLTGDPHMGHAMQHAILDAIARFKRMQGYDVLLLPGVDHAGIQFESTLNKQLEKKGMSKRKLGREEWLKKAWEFKEQVYQTFHGTWSVFGISADWGREVFTLEPKVQQTVLTEFKTFWEQDLLYKGAYIVQWCPKDATAIEDVEMEYQEKKEKLYYITYKVENAEEYITVATARPETIAADVAIAVYPKHPKYKHLVGKYAINPFTNTRIPVIEDKRVEKEFGTGALKITPGHDLLDYEIGKTHGLPILHVVNKEGRITDLDPALQGLKIAEARNKAAEALREKGLIEKEEDYTHSVPVCERCKTTVEPLISEEWFVKMEPLAKKALKHLKKVKFFPANYEKITRDWLENVHDWSISRSLWWGHRIPVWYCETCNPNHQVGKDKDMVVSLEKPNHPCQTCGKHVWVQDEQVLDTWFSSGMWPLATLGWPTGSKSEYRNPKSETIANDKKSKSKTKSVSNFEHSNLEFVSKFDISASNLHTQENKELDRYYPWSFEITAPEIKYLWIARMIMLGLWFRDDVPFTNMFFHGTLRDLQGRKMSKSLGNGVDPIELIKQWGTDPVRMTLYSYSTPGRDPRASRQTMDERCKNYRNFGTKLRNITRFVIDLKPEDTPSTSDFTHEDDFAIKEKLDGLIVEVTKDLDTFQLHLAVENLYDFIWHEFADKYIEQSKARRQEAQPVLEYVLATVIRLLHPFMPFLAEELYQKLPKHGESIMVEQWPTV